MNLLKAIELGADKIYVFGNYHPKSSIINGKLVFKSWLLIKNKIFKKNQMRYLNIMENIKIPDNVEIFHFKPDKRLLITPWRNNRKDLIKTYMRGYNETLEKIAQLQ